MTGTAPDQTSEEPPDLEAVPGDAPGRETVAAARVVGETLWELGVRQVFGVVGSGNFVATTALVGEGARYVAARHEGAAVTMADAHARVSGELAVCSVHQGPGLTNTLTGLVDAAKSRTPLLVIAGETSAGATRSNFYVDQAGLVERAGAIAERLYRPETVAEDTARAVRRARAERRPVVLNMPLDVQAAAMSRASRAGGDAGASEIIWRPRPPADSVARIAEWLAAARRPLILAGRGAAASGARDSLLSLGERTGALLAHTAVANGFFGDHPWSLGIAGGFATDEAAGLMAEADVVLGFGCSFTDWTTRHGRLFGPDATVVQVDTNPDALGLSDRVNLGVAGDADETARALLGELATADGGNGQSWRTNAVADRMSRRGRGEYADKDAGTPGTIHPKVLSLELETMLPAQRTVVVDGGHFIGWPITCWTVPDPEGFVFTSSGFQSIGLGLGSAVGAAVARPDRLTVLAAGDGGLLMSVSELETLVRLRLPVLVVVYDDAAYGAEVHHFSTGDVVSEDLSGRGIEAGPSSTVQRARDLDVVRFPGTDIAALARGAGAGGVTVRDVADLAPVATWLANPDGPLVVDAKVDPAVVGYWAEQDFQGH